MKLVFSTEFTKPGLLQARRFFYDTSFLGNTSILVGLLLRSDVSHYLSKCMFLERLFFSSVSALIRDPTTVAWPTPGPRWRYATTSYVSWDRQNCRVYRRVTMRASRRNVIYVTWKDEKRKPGGCLRAPFLRPDRPEAPAGHALFMKNCFVAPARLGCWMTSSSSAPSQLDHEKELFLRNNRR